MRVYVALAAVMTLLLVVGMSTMGDGGGFIKTIQSLVGEREVIKANSGDDNKIIEAESEEEAYQKIRDELKIKPAQIMDIPLKAKFKKAVIEKN